MADAEVEEYGRLYPEEERLTFPDPCVVMRRMSLAIRNDIETNPGYTDGERSLLTDVLLGPGCAAEPITELGRLVLIASEVKPVMGRIVAGPDGSRTRPARNGDKSPMFRPATSGKAVPVMVQNVEPMSIQERGIIPKAINPIVVAACKKIMHTPASGRSYSEEAANRHRRVDVAVWAPLLGTYARPVVNLITRYETNTAYFIDEIMRRTVHGCMEGYLEIREDAPIRGYSFSRMPTEEQETSKAPKMRNWFGLRSPA